MARAQIFLQLAVSIFLCSPTSHILLLLKLMITISPSTAICERGFFCMNQVKTNHTSLFSEKVSKNPRKNQKWRLMHRKKLIPTLNVVWHFLICDFWYFRFRILHRPIHVSCCLKKFIEMSVQLEPNICINDCNLIIFVICVLKMFLVHVSSSHCLF